MPEPKDPRREELEQTLEILREVAGDLGIPRIRRYLVRTELPLPREAAGVTVERSVDPVRLPITNGNQANVHTSPVACRAL